MEWRGESCEKAKPVDKSKIFRIMKTVKKVIVCRYIKPYNLTHEIAFRRKLCYIREGSEIVAFPFQQNKKKQAFIISAS